MVRFSRADDNDTDDEKEKKSERRSRSRTGGKGKERPVRIVRINRLACTVQRELIITRGSRVRTFNRPAGAPTFRPNSYLVSTYKMLLVRQYFTPAHARPLRHGDKPGTVASLSNGSPSKKTCSLFSRLSLSLSLSVWFSCSLGVVCRCTPRVQLWVRRMLAILLPRLCAALTRQRGCPRRVRVTFVHARQRRCSLVQTERACSRDNRRSVSEERCL